MRIQVLSDLHLELEQQPTADTPVGAQLARKSYHYDFPTTAEYLALLGDTGRTCDAELFDWLDRQLERYEIVFYLAGNHEPYGSSLAESHNRLLAYQNRANDSTNASYVASRRHIGRFIYLNRTRYDLTDTLTILGCTLWGSLDPSSAAHASLNDFQHIRGFTPTLYTSTHKEDLAWLNQSVAQLAREEPDREILVFTHHAPTVEGTSDPRFQARPTSAAFATELSAEPSWTQGNVKLWAFGHTHWCCDFERNGVRVYSNQKGRGEGVEGYDPSKFLKLGSI